MKLIITVLASLVAYSTAQYATPVVNQGLYLDLPPYRWFMRYDRPSYITDIYDQQLISIASQYNVDIYDLYQLYSIVDSHLPNSLPETNIYMMQRIAESIQRERIRRGLLVSPWSYYSTPLVNPVNNPGYILQKRGPLDIMSAMYNDASATMSNLYNNLYNMADYLAPSTTQALTNEVQDIVDDIPDVDTSLAEDLTSSLTANIRFMLS